MKRHLQHRIDHRPGHWLDDLARALIREGTHARRALESALNPWTGRPTANLGDTIGSALFDARIRAIFLGDTTLSTASEVGTSGCLSRDGRWM